MNGFALRTKTRVHYCDNCSLWYPHTRHKCHNESPFFKMPAGEKEYTGWVDTFSKWDTGTWNTALNIQIAGVFGWDGAYVLTKDFHKNYHASLVTEKSYSRLRPSGTVRILCGLCGDTEAVLYINNDLSAALLIASEFQQIINDYGRQHHLP